MPAWGIQIRQDTVTPRLTGFSERMRKNIADGFVSVGYQMVTDGRSIVVVRTGYLRSTIFAQVIESDLILVFGATAPYAPYVEFGTSRMAPRPFIRPAFDANQQRILDALLAGVLDAWKI